MNDPLKLIIEDLPETNQKLMVVILRSLKKDDENIYRKLAELFNHKADVNELLNEINKNL